MLALNIQIYSYINWKNNIGRSSAKGETSGSGIWWCCIPTSKPFATIPLSENSGGNPDVNNLIFHQCCDDGAIRLFLGVHGMVVGNMSLATQCQSVALVIARNQPLCQRYKFLERYNRQETLKHFRDHDLSKSINYISYSFNHEQLVKLFVYEGH